jgi:RNA polymerase sigma-70 factor, ECF subfamily
MGLLHWSYLVRFSSRNRYGDLDAGCQGRLQKWVAEKPVRKNTAFLCNLLHSIASIRKYASSQNPNGLTLAGNNQDQAFLAGLRQGDADCYSKMVNEYIGPMLGVARRYLDEDDARDAVQEAFIKLHSAIDTFRGESSLLTWLQRILINICLSRLRKAKQVNEVSIDDFLPDFFEDGHRMNPKGDWPGALSESMSREKICELMHANIKLLPDTYRTVLLLRDIDGFSCRETAEKLEISETATKVRLHRARLALRELLEPLILGESFEL